MQGPGEITQLLAIARKGDDEAANRLMDLIYGELRKLASKRMAVERPGHTLQATALVHEAFLRLVSADIDFSSRSHFFYLAARTMRRILIDWARRPRAVHIELEDHLAMTTDAPETALAVDAALTRLAGLDPRQAQIVEMRFFGGLKEEEIAEVLGVSRRTVVRDWLLAKAWLKRELRGKSSR